MGYVYVLYIHIFVALCGALPASARRALGPCVVALRDACARCTYEMPFPEHWNEESNDEY